MTKLFLTLTPLLLVGCQLSLEPKSNGQVYVEDSLNMSAEANATAKTPIDWHASKDHPEKLFARLIVEVQQRQITQEEVCGALGSLADADLVLFENEIEKEDSLIAIKPCRAELVAKMEKYWKAHAVIQEQRADGVDLSPNVVNFGETEVQFRDTSEGYYAVTGDVKPKQVVLTFDDGPHPSNTEAILATLKKANIRALFFEMGQNVRRYPHMTQKVAEGGHSIGSHSVTHSCLPARSLCRHSNDGKILTYEEGVAEIRGGHQAIYDVLGWVDPFFRFPFGEASLELKDYLRKHSTGEFLWNIDSEDWKNKLENGSPNTPQTVVDSVMAQLKPRGRGILLFHDIQRRTAEALPLMLRRLKEEGYQTVVFQPKDLQSRFNSKIVGPRKPVN